MNIYRFRSRVAPFPLIEYPRVAWTGGSVPLERPIIARRYGPDVANHYLCIAQAMEQEQVRDYFEYWKESPDVDTRQIFKRRAQHDAWSTIRSMWGDRPIEHIEGKN